MNWKQRIRGGIRTYATCLLISATIYMFVVIQNTYQNLLNGKADAYTLMAFILFLGFLIFVVVEVSPPFRKFLFRMHGVEEETKKKETAKNENTSQNEV